MKTISLKSMLICFLFVGATLSAQQKKTATVGDSQFLLQAFNARMLATDYAKLAVKKGTTPQIRQFGKRMVTDQNQMYKAIKPLGASRNAVFPKSVNYIDGNGRDKLAKLSGPDFDRRYKIQTAQDLEKDITLFKQAATSKNKEISALAKEFLPLLESELKDLQELE
jgi:putative membrane protein